MALPNSEKITSQIAMLPDAALKQMAMMHKSDPYVLPLIISEDSRRKQMRQAAQAQMASMPQPKVADAAVAQMGALPEEQGIGALPAPNMQRMADGGIAGYGDDANEGEGMAMGGSMFDFAQRSEPVLRMAGGGMPKYAGKADSLVRTTTGGKSWFLDIPKTIRDPSVPYYRQVPNPLASLADQEFPSKDAAIQAYNTATQTVAASGPTVTGADMGMPTGVGLPAGTDVSTLQQPTYAPPGAQPSGNKPPAPPAAQQGLGSIALSKTLTAEQAKEQAGEFADFGEARTALKKAESDQESQGARLRTMLADNLPKTPAMEGLEKLLDKQDAETGGEKDKAAGLALLSAGLAIAGGSSRFALQNLKEAIPAVTQYGDALKDIKKMERENMKMRGEIEQARRAESRDDTKLKLQLEEKIGERQDNINKLGVELTSKIAGVNADVASKLWTTSATNASHERAAVAAAQAHTAGQINYLERLGSASPESALRKGYDLTQQERQQAGILSNYEKMAGDQTMTTGGKYATKGEEFRAKYPTPQVYAAAIASLGGGAGGQGQIYTDNTVNPNAIRPR